MLLIAAIHLVIFQLLFLIKNIVTAKRTGFGVRGKNSEANIAIICFIFTFITVFTTLVVNPAPALTLFTPLWSVPTPVGVTGVFLLIMSLTVSATALVQMKNSWRVGVKENDSSELISHGVFAVSRNPYFLSYILMFLAYILLVPTAAVAASSLISILSIHRMILCEEKHLYSMFRGEYVNYFNRVPRYLLLKTRIIVKG